ncbi:MAG TPA: hypothetical protein VFT62_09365 [Mycobacteriales bacterium]|nr:hypothetical protein [Mycobacteriales bacterium]
MRRRVVAGVVAVVLAGSGVGTAALAGAPSTESGGGDVVAQCYAQLSNSLDDPGYKFCRSVQAAEWSAAAACRMPERTVGAPDQCGVVDGRVIDEAQVAAYEKSWVHRALTLQRGLDAEAPLWEEQIPHTHNSFNASAYALPTDGSLPSYYPTVTNQDPNQVYSMADQLRMDIRAIEIDLHWVPSPYGSAATHGYWPTICHGDGEDPTGSGLYVHIGCSDDRPMQDGLAEVRRWLDANPGQFVIVYLENQLYPGGPIASQTQAHDVAAGIIKSQLGPKVFTPPAGLKAGRCAPMPYDETRAAMLAAGKQVLLVGNCGPGAWNQWVFTRGPAWDESGDPTSYGAAQCAADEAAREHHTSFRRYFEESTWEEAETKGAPGPLAGGTTVVTPRTTARMVRCGVNLVGFDQLQPFDGRLAAFVWSWAQGEPGERGGCAVQGADTRFRAVACGGRHPFACVDRHLDWHVTDAVGPWRDGWRACAEEFPGSRYGVPPNGYRNAQIAAAKAGRSQVWLNYRQRHGAWTPDIPAPQAARER